MSYFLLTDQVGTLRAVADSTGTIVKRIDYDSFGNIISDSNPAFTVPFGFAGGLHDRDTGLVRFGYRDYSPELGRFVAKDPIDFAGGDTNLYSYAMANPIGRVDPLGLKDYFLGVEFDLALSWFGVDLSGGIVLDSDNLGESGFYRTRGIASGATLGLGFVGGACSEIEGEGVTWDINIGPVSPQVIYSAAGGNPIGAAFGVSPIPGAGFSMSGTTTTTYSYSEMRRRWRNERPEDLVLSP